MSDKEELEQMVNKPGTFSKVTEVSLKTILEKGILREKRRFLGVEFALSFHLAQAEQKSNFFGGGSSSYEKHDRKIGNTIGVILNEKFTKLVKGNILERDIEKLFELGNTVDPYIRWKENWEDAKDYLEKHNISLKEYNQEIPIEKGRRYLGEYVYTIAALNDLVEVTTAWGVRAYFMNKNKIIRPFNRIYLSYIKAIVKPEYTRKEKRLIQKFKDKIKFYKRDPETGTTELLN